MNCPLTPIWTQGWVDSRVGFLFKTSSRRACGGMTNVKAFYILEGEYIDATRDEILKNYGSIDGYLTKGLELTKRDIQRLRDRLLE